ncbi:NIPSNAP domain containing protein [Xanthomonas arboricola]|uniref:NIPSNAP family protein n=1 Tax=Xanthomonas arboricola TaxID=56448 RepID=UPI00061A22EE|nr:NIPSNAP family protein [Xanthomonas arboricola]AKC80635.1 NIPSNAP domain containing protein [Xanthomonas arboricola]
MLIEQRVYTLKPGSLLGFLRLYEAEGLALQREVLGNLVGYFTSEVGKLNRVIHLWGYDSFEDRARRRTQLHGDPAWREFLSKAGPLVESQSNELWLPTAFSPLGNAA